MLIDATHEEETRVAILNGNRIEDFDFESAAKKQLKGNIYLAKVTRVEPSLQAAFVDYGGNRHGFLAFSEIHPDYYQIPVEDRQALLEQEAAEAEAEAEAESEDAAAPSGDDEPEIESVGADDEEEIEQVRAKPRPNRRYKIQEVIKRRQILLIQVVKEERGNKGAALTTYISLAGRYCVLMPNTSRRGGGISRKISNAADRKKLKKIQADLNVPPGVACIIRTAGSKRTKPEIRRDYEYLMRLWENIRELTLQSMAPALIHEEGNLIKRAIRDLYSRDIEEVLVEGEAGYKNAKSFMRMLIPSHAKKVRHYIDDIPLFHRYQVEVQLDSMFNPVVELRSGGYIVINPTEALVSVDVNSGRATREHNIEETALKTNVEAAEEVARQLRLRDMAGLIVIDFIDMEEAKNNRTVERKLKDCLKSDRARIQVGKISPFGLLEMSRQRLRPGVLEASTRTCPMCEGAGIVRSTESAALYALRTIEEEAIRRRAQRLILHAAPEVALYVLNQKRDSLHSIEQRFGVAIFVMADENAFVSQIRLEREGVKPDEGDQPAAASDSAPAEQAAPANSDGEPASDGRKKKRRRRPRRKTAEDARETQVQEDQDQTADNAPREGGEEKPKKRRRGRRGGRGRNARSQENKPQELEGQDTREETGSQETLAPDEQPVVPDEQLVAAGEQLVAPDEQPVANEPSASEAAAPEAPTPDVPLEDVPAEVAKPKRARRTRRKKVTETAPQETAPEAEAAPEAETTPEKAEAQADEPAEGAPAAPKPAAKRPRRRPRKSAATPAEETSAEPPAAEPAAVEPVPAPAEPEPAPAEPAPTEPPAAEPPANADEPAKPPRKGWWQRTFQNPS
jgi:ribonuclease E